MPRPTFAASFDPGGVYPRSVAAAWAVAFDQLAGADPTAMELLGLLAWLGPEPVPPTLPADHPDALPPTLARAVADPLTVTHLLLAQGSLSRGRVVAGRVLGRLRGGRSGALERGGRGSDRD